MYENWQPSVLSPYKAEATIDIFEEGRVKVEIDAQWIVLHANDGKAYLEPDQARQLLHLLDEALTIHDRYEADEPDMIEGVNWRAWRRQALGLDERHPVR
jgi:hypothetical protein